MNTLDRMLKGADKAISLIESPKLLVAANIERYLKVAKSTARQTVLNLQPEGTDTQEWRQQVEYFTAAIFSESLSLGFSISYRGRRAAQSANGIEEGSSASIDDVTFDDVLEWVEAGIQGDPDGKEIQDYDKDATSTAHRIYRVTSEDYQGQGDYSGIRQRLNEWADDHVSQSFEGLLEAVLSAWAIILPPMIEEDYIKHIDRVLRDL